MTASLPFDPSLAEARARAAAGEWEEVLTLLAPRVADGACDGETTLLHGEALMRTGHERSALAWLQTSEARLIEDGDRAAHRRAINMIGAAYLALGELEAAAGKFSSALELATQADDLLVLARATNNLGAIANLQGDRERALSHYRLALPTFQRLGQQRGLAAGYHNIAITFRDVGELEEADENERRAIEYATGVAPRLAAMGRVGRAEIALRRGDAPLAETSARIVVEELRRLGDRQNEADALRLVGSACAAQQRYDDALEAYDRALDIARDRGHALNEAETLRDRSQTYVHRGQPALAIADATAAIALFAKLGAVTEREALEHRLALLR